MAKTPEAPDLTIRKSFLRFVIEGILRAIIGTWLFAQAIGFIFYLMWHNFSIGAREFMFRRYINVWDEHGYAIQNELTPPWLQWIWSIPTWQDVWPWVVIAALIALYVWGNRNLPSLNVRVPRTYKTKADNPYNSKRGKAGNAASDDEFEFDPSAFAESSKGEKSGETKTSSAPSKEDIDKKLLQGLIDNPSTPKNEKKAAQKMLADMRRLR